MPKTQSGLGHDRGTDRNRRESDYPQEDQRDRQTHPFRTYLQFYYIECNAIVPPCSSKTNGSCDSVPTASQPPLLSISMPSPCAVAFLYSVPLRPIRSRITMTRKSEPSNAYSSRNRNRDVAITASATRGTIARHCRYRGNPTAAALITSALSPLRTNSIIALLVHASSAWQPWPSYLAGSSPSFTLTVRC